MLTFVDTAGNTFSVDTDTGIEIENIKAILEADVCRSSADQTGIPVDAQSLRFQDQELTDAVRTLDSYGVKNDDLLVIHDTRKGATTVQQQPQEEAAAELLRQQLLQDRPLFTELMRVCFIC